MSIGERRDIKKYRNRKLYDINNARYISMVELAGVVFDGEEVAVIDDCTGRDVTVETLARALYERIKRYFASSKSVQLRSEDPFSRQILANLIRQVPPKH